MTPDDRTAHEADPTLEPMRGWRVPVPLRLLAVAATAPLIVIGGFLTVTIVGALIGLPLLVAGGLPLWGVLDADRPRFGHPAIPLLLLGALEIAVGVMVRSEAPSSIQDPDAVGLAIIALGVLALLTGSAVAAFSKRIAGPAHSVHG